MKRLIFALSIVALTIGGVSCAKQGATESISGTLRIGLPITPTNLNGILAQNTNEVFVDGLIYSQLVALDDESREIPDLAERVPTLANGDISKDGLTITYHLRRNVKWHDGVPFTSKDVAFSWKAVMNRKNNVVARNGFDQVASVATPDAYTAVFHMKRIFPPAIEALFGESDSPTFILPEHLLAKYPDVNQIPFNSAPIGTGPFKFARWLRGDRIVLSANPDYFLGAPKLKQIAIMLIPDANTTESQLRSHDIDLAFELTGTNWHNFANDPGFVRLLAKSPSFTAVLFNTSRAPLDDPQVRKALVMGIDSRRITATDTYGAGTIASGDLGPFYWAFDPSLKPADFDPAAAGAILQADGWITGADGIRVKDGKRLSLQIVYGQGNPTSANIIVQLQQMLQHVGVAVEPKSYSFAVLFAAAQNGGIYNKGSFDAGLYSWIAGGDPDNSSNWLSSQIPPAGNDITRYRSAEMDALQHAALSTFDRAARKKAYLGIERLLLRDHVGAFLYYQGERHVITPSFTGYAPNGIDAAWNAYTWDLK